MVYGGYNMYAKPHGIKRPPSPKKKKGENQSIQFSPLRLGTLYPVLPPTRINADSKIALPSSINRSINPNA
jgi:hypothetical protein